MLELLMGGAMGKRQGAGGGKADATPESQERSRRGLPFRQKQSLSDFNLVGMASNWTQRFSVLSGLSFISFMSVPQNEANRRPRSKVSRKRWHQSTLENEFAQCKTIWPVAQTEALFLPEFPIGIDEKLQLVFLGEISRGAFGQVFHVKCASTNREYAMKVLSKSQVCSLDAVGQVKQEVMIQQVCSHHPFITPLTHFWQTRKLLIVMTEYIGYGELQQLWWSLGILPENLLALYVAEIALTLDFLHNAGIIYRDLKMENILLDVDGHIKLIDFGLARWLSYGGHTSTICGTLQFMAPEVLRGETYTHSVDWWSLGIITYSLLSGHYPVSGYDDHQTMSSAVEKFIFKPPESASRAMKSLVSGLLNRDPSARLHSVGQLEREELYRYTNFDEIREKKVSPRKLLEEFIEGKNRRNFVEFGGLTSTPKRTTSGTKISAGVGSRRSPTSSFLHPSTFESSWGRGKRSVSSPLLHPGRLGHHDALVKSVSSAGHNGAAVPMLQSPLLRLARGQAGIPPRRAHSQGTISASSLPTAVSPLLVNVRGNRKALREVKEDPIPSNPTSRACGAQVAISGMNGIYKKCASEEFVQKTDHRVRPQIPHSHTSDNTRQLNPTTSDLPLAISHIPAIPSHNSPVPPHISPNYIHNLPTSPFIPPTEAFLENSENLKEEFFCDLVTSTPKKESFSGTSVLKRNSQAPLASQRPSGKLINGALLANNNNFSPLDENDFDDTFEDFPWISESLDT